MFKWIWTWAVILALPLFLTSPIALAETQHQLKEVGMPITLAVWNTLSTRERVLYISGLIDMSEVDIPDAKERAYLIGTILGELHGYSNSHKDQNELVRPNAQAMIEGWKAGSKNTEH